MVITLSRQEESGSEEISQVIAEHLELQVIDRRGLEQLIQQETMSASHLAVFGEVLPTAIGTIFAEWRTAIDLPTYLRRLVHILLLLERKDRVLVLGRGAVFVLGDPGTFHARIIAPMSFRMARLIQKRGISKLEAERMLRRNDEAKAQFIRQAFSADIESPGHYDLTLNAAELSAQEAAEIIELAASRKAVRRVISTEANEYILNYLSKLRLRDPSHQAGETILHYYERRSGRGK